LGYLPAARSRRASTLERKRREYLHCIPKYFDQARRDDSELEMLHQIEVDVPRTCPAIGLFQHARIQQMLTRVLYIWALHHPASGYVQGINDLLTPFIAVFLSEYVEGGHDQPHSCDLGVLQQDAFDAVEADAYWCLTKLLDGIQDHFTFAQPGIQRMVFKLGEVMQRVEPKLHAHLERNQLELIQFSFRWMNCLLLRELPESLSTRLWDTYLAEGAASFGTLHVYVCAALISRFSSELMQLDFQECVLLLQHLPTGSWDDGVVEEMLAQAHVWREIHDGAHY
jgi:hypothetical protein